MSNGELPGEQQNIQKLLEENNRLLKELQAGMVQVQRYIYWNRVWGMLRLLIILTPIIVGIIYLRPYVQNVLSTYQELFGVAGTSSSTPPSSLDLMDQLKQYELELNN